MKAENIKKFLIHRDATIKEAMKKLSAGGDKILFIMDDDDRLTGSVTDGDIRRAILSDVGLGEPVSKVMFKSPKFVKRSEANFEEKAERLVVKERRYAVPVLDGSGRIGDILFWHDFLEYHPLESHPEKPLSNPVVIMAGGKGTRLDPFTKILPKPLIPLGDKPIIEKIMDGFNAFGFTNFILTLNYRKEAIKMYFRENQVPYSVEWVEEEDFQGTAGSLGLLKDRLKETFFVTNCDIILDSDFKNILLWHKGEGADMTLVGCHREVKVPYGTLEIDGGNFKGINEKPNFDVIINTGIYVMEPGVLEHISVGERLDMNGLVERVLNAGKVAVYPVYDGWFDVGQWKEYSESITLLQGGNISIR